MPPPGRRPHELQRRLLQRPRHEERLHELGGTQPVRGGPPGDHGRHPQARREDLGQRADVHHRAVAVHRRQRRGRLPGQVAGVVVLHHERARRPRHLQHLLAAFDGQGGAGGVVQGGLAEEYPRPRHRERLGQQLGPHAVAVHRHRRGPQPRRPGRGQRSRIGGRLDEDGRTGSRQRSERVRERRLSAAHDQRVGPCHVAAGLRGEPAPQLRQPGQRRPGPGARPAYGPRRRGGQLLVRPQPGPQISTGQRHHPLGRRPQQGRDRPVVHHPIPERDGLPGQIGRVPRRPHRRGHEGTAARPRHHPPFCGQLPDRPGDGDGADVVPAHDLPTGRQPRARPEVFGLFAQYRGDLSDTAIVVHEIG